MVNNINMIPPNYRKDKEDLGLYRALHDLRRPPPRMDSLVILFWSIITAECKKWGNQLLTASSNKSNMIMNK